MRFLRSCLVEVVYIGIKNPLELPRMQKEQVVEALTSHTAQEERRSHSLAGRDTAL